MKCPLCEHALGNQITVSTRPVVFQFIMQPSSDNTLRRANDLSAVEEFSLDVVGVGTHFSTCPHCKQAFDVSTVSLVPVCCKCGQEFSKLNPTDNSCFYEGLMCVGCAKKQARSVCADCGRLSKCKLAARAAQATPK